MARYRAFEIAVLMELVAEFIRMRDMVLFMTCYQDSGNRHGNQEFRDAEPTSHHVQPVFWESTKHVL